MAHINLIRCIAKPSMAWKDMICLAIYELMYSKCHIMSIAWRIHQMEGGHPSSSSSIHDECTITTTKYNYSSGIHHHSNAYGSHINLNDIQLGIVPCEPSLSLDSNCPDGPSITKLGTDQKSARSPHHAHRRSSGKDKGPKGRINGINGTYNELEGDWVDTNESDSDHWVSDDEESDNDSVGNKADENWTFFTGSHIRRKFPPPLDSLYSRHEENTRGPHGCRTMSTTAYCLRSFRMEGRLVLREARTPTYEYLKVSRKDGCLKVDLMNPHTINH